MFWQEMFEIQEGFHRGGVFWIAPFNHDITAAEADYPLYDKGFVKNTDEKITIDEAGFIYLWKFFEPYFDSDLQKQFIFVSCREPTDDVQKIEWYDQNLFTYEQVSKAIHDIRHHAQLLKIDNQHSDLTWFYDFYFSKLEDNERENFFAQDLPMLIDYYERFCERVERMMKNSPQYHILGFDGP